MKKKLICLLLLITLITFVGCIPGDGKHTAEKPAGILLGHLARLDRTNLIRYGNCLNPDIRLYEPNNTGWWYDFGFYIAVISGFGGISFSRSRRKKTVVQTSSNSE